MEKKEKCLIYDCKVTVVDDKCTEDRINADCEIVNIDMIKHADKKMIDKVNDDYKTDV